MDPDNPAGNYLAIEMESSPFTIVLAHVQKSSFLIEKGERVQKGQPLCRVGNSGNTSEPHLHIHAVKSGEDLLFEGAGIPMKFNHRFLVRNNRVSSAAEN
jgi:murein DD-endopeptidase MepM/ murein hydrolase activator NlpD